MTHNPNDAFPPRPQEDPFQMLCFQVAAMCDPGCRNARARLRRIKRVLEGQRVDKLELAQICLDEVEREKPSGRRKDMWRKATKRLSKVLQRRSK